MTGRSVLVAALAVVVCACGGTVTGSGAAAPLAVLSAFPAEMAPLVAQAEVVETAVVNGRVFRIGTLRGLPVIIGLTGIGLANATNTTRALLDQFRVRGIIVSAVAGSTLRIGDVTVPSGWTYQRDATYAVYEPWLKIAAEVAASGVVELQQCTVRPNPKDGTVCLPFVPIIAVGGTGQSTDLFPDTPTMCQPRGGDVLGCDIAGNAVGADVSEASPIDATAAAEMPIATDNETAGIAREATARGIPLIAFRAVSDGADDPLGLPGYPLQFFTYYHLAADNAAAATLAFLDRLATASAH
ncbi:MAG TPA: hypothetical protein VMW17_00055 [Candidatus Binatia bacterium]|nr:hypothetical protein [Candidatus Binatia bacterium]